MPGDFKPIETQEAFDAAVRARLAREREKAEARFADYDDLRGRAERAEAAHVEAASALEEARRRVAELEAEAAERGRADEAARARERVSRETGVPADLIAGEDEEAMTAFAARVAEYARVPSAPAADSAGSFARGDAPDSGFRQIARALAGGE